MIHILQMRKQISIGVVFIILTLIGSSCSGKTQQRSLENRVVAGLLTSYYPKYVLNAAQNKWVVKGYDSLSVKIFFYKGLALYRIFYLNQTVNRLNGEIIGEPVTDYLFYNVVVSDHSSMAYRFDSTDLENGFLISNKDSLISKQPVLGFNVDEILRGVYHNLIASTSIPGGIQEKYSIVAKTDSAQKGNVVLIFSKSELAEFPYSIGKDIEENKGMRLVKAVVTTDGRYINPGNYYLSEAVIPTSIKQIYLSDAEEKELKQIFDWVFTSKQLKE